MLGAVFDYFWIAKTCICFWKDEGEREREVERKEEKTKSDRRCLIIVNLVTFRHVLCSFGFAWTSDATSFVRFLYRLFAFNDYH